MAISIIKSLTANSSDKLVDSDQFIETENAILEFVRSDPESISKWHHHGEYDIFNYIVSGTKQFLLNSGEVITAEQGDLVHVSKNTIHRDSNPSKEPVEYLLIRIGKGQSLFHVDASVTDV